MKLLAIGGRNFTSMWMNDVLDKVHNETPVDEVFHTGEPIGAAWYISCWAASNKIKETGFRPQWAKHGKSAAKVRNLELVNLKPGLVVVFPGGLRTRLLFEVVKEYGLPTLVPLKTKKLGFYDYA